MQNSEQIRERLLARKTELEQATNQFGQDARESNVADVEDEIDQVASSEAKTAFMKLSSQSFESLQAVIAALARLDDGTYGQCTVCGRSIGSSRLQAIPETPYCIDHARQAEEQTEMDEPDLGTVHS